MIMCFLDSNILISYLYEEHVFHQQSSNIIQALVVDKKISLSISPLVLNEVMMGIMKNTIILQKQSKSEAIKRVNRGIKQVLKLPNITIINPPDDPASQLKVISYMEKFSLKPRDAYHLLTIKHHCIQYFATLDHDFDLVFQKTSLKLFPQTPKVA